MPVKLTITPAPPRLHAAEIFTAEIDVIEDLCIPAGAPSLLIYGFQRAGRNVAGIVDQYIDVAAGVRYAPGESALGEVDRERAHLHGKLPANRVGGLSERAPRAGGKMKIAAFSAKRCAIARPKPFEPPVISTILPFRLQVHASARWYRCSSGRYPRMTGSNRCERMGGVVIDAVHHRAARADMIGDVFDVGGAENARSIDRDW